MQNYSKFLDLVPGYGLSLLFSCDTVIYNEKYMLGFVSFPQNFLKRVIQVPLLC